MNLHCDRIDPFSADHAYELAMYLDLLNRNFLPQAPEIFAVAERAMSKVKASDPEFYNHLKNVAQINPTISPKVWHLHFRSFLGSYLYIHVHMCISIPVYNVIVNLRSPYSLYLFLKLKKVFIE